MRHSTLVAMTLLLAVSAAHAAAPVALGSLSIRPDRWSFGSARGSTYLKIKFDARASGYWASGSRVTAVTVCDVAGARFVDRSAVLGFSNLAPGNVGKLDFIAFGTDNPLPATPNECAVGFVYEQGWGQDRWEAQLGMRCWNPQSASAWQCGDAKPQSAPPPPSDRAPLVNTAAYSSPPPATSSPLAFGDARIRVKKWEYVNGGQIHLEVTLDVRALADMGRDFVQARTVCTVGGVERVDEFGLLGPRDRIPVGVTKTFNFGAFGVDNPISAKPSRCDLHIVSIHVSGDGDTEQPLWVYNFDRL